MEVTVIPEKPKLKKAAVKKSCLLLMKKATGSKRIKEWLLIKAAATFRIH
jgi:hypothetical protein